MIFWHRRACKWCLARRSDASKNRIDGRNCKMTLIGATEQMAGSDAILVAFPMLQRCQLVNFFAGSCLLVGSQVRFMSYQLPPLSTGGGLDVYGGSRLDYSRLARFPDMRRITHVSDFVAHGLRQRTRLLL